MPSGFGTYNGLDEWGPFEWPLSLEGGKKKQKPTKGFLAVEFKPNGKTSYLDGITPSGFSKGVISFWFRVPAASIAAAAAQRNFSDPFNQLIPLLCLGPTGVNHPYVDPHTLADACHTFFQFNPGGQIFTERDLGFTPHQEAIESPSQGAGIPTLPTLVGLNCSGGTATLFINLQTNQFATITNTVFATIGVVPANTYAYIGAGPPNTPAVYTYQDTSNLFYGKTQWFEGSNTITVTPDHWHHVLLSFDLRDVLTHGTNSFATQDGVTSNSRMWLSFDDVNKLADDLSRYWPDGSTDPNAILTRDAFDIANRGINLVGPGTYNSTAANDYGTFQYNLPAPGTTPKFVLSNPEIPGSGDIGIPATSSDSGHIYNVDMGELQIFTGTSIDTGNVAMRRLFVDKNGVPVDPSKAAQGLGQQPQILLHGSGNWAAGANGGSSLHDLNPTGPIPIFKPNPSLHGPQS